MSKSMVNRYIKKLNLGSSPGNDGIMAEHLKYAVNSKIIDHLSVMFSLCLKYGIVPTSFSQGLLIPLLKKTTLDPTIAKNYRPITISNTMSKILELYILDVSGHHDFCDLQFGFVAGRGTDMATSMAHDVFSYCTRRGSPVYMFTRCRRCI